MADDFKGSYVPGEAMAGKLEERGYPGILHPRPYPGLQPVHKFDGLPGIIGGNCNRCGHPASAPIHNTEEDNWDMGPGKLKVMDDSQRLEIIKRPAVNVERIAPDSVRYEFEHIPNNQALRIVLDILPKALELYLQKSKDYGGNVMDRFGLGEKAAIPDMARKFGKLIDAIWHDKPLQFEQPDEILMDLLGHILIILDQRSQGQ